MVASLAVCVALSAFLTFRNSLSQRDKDSKYRLILVESRVHRLARYYKRTGVLAPNWKYESATASALVS